MTSADQTFYGSDFGQLQSQDPEIAGVLLSELDRLRGGLQLIASENLTSPAVLAALGSTLSNKYAEGYPGRRYYGGCSEVDKAESIGIERAKRLFEADHANLQPHSGASANQAVYGAFCQPGDTILAMSPAARWPPDPRHQGVLQRQVVQRRALRRRQADRGHRLRPGARARAQHRPKVIVAGGVGHPAADRLRLLPRPRRRGRRDLLGRRRALHRPGRRQGHPEPRALRRRRHLHHAQGAARSPRRDVRLPGRARGEDGQGGLPDDAGRSADALGRGQGGQPAGVPAAGVPDLRPAGHRQRPAAGRRRWGSAASARSPAAPTPTSRCTTCRASA